MGFETLRKKRRELGISQEVLAEMLGVSRQAVSKWESGDGYPEVEKIIALSDILGVSIDYLLRSQDYAPTVEASVGEDNTVETDVEKVSADTAGTTEPVVEASTEKITPAPRTDGKIVIKTRAGAIVTCSGVKKCPIAFPAKRDPKFILKADGISKILSDPIGWYAEESDIDAEISELFDAIARGDRVYKLKHDAEVVFGILGGVKIAKKK